MNELLSYFIIARPAAYYIYFFRKLFCINCSDQLFPSTNNAKKKNTLVPGNPGDEKNVHPGRRKTYFLTNLIDFF